MIQQVSLYRLSDLLLLERVIVRYKFLLFWVWVSLRWNKKTYSGGKEIFGHFTTRFFGPCCVHNRVGREEEKPSQVYKAILSQYPIFKHSWANIYIWCLQVRGSIARRCLKYLDLMFTFKVSDLGKFAL